MFKINDYVRVKDGTQVEEQETPINGWGGKVMEVYQNKEETTYLIEFDAPTLGMFSNQYIETGIENGSSEDTYIFNESDLLPMKRRDTDAQRKTAYNELMDRVEELDPDTYEFPEFDQEAADLIYHDFSESPFFETLTEAEKEDAGFAVDCLQSYLFNYEGLTLTDATVEDIATVCLGWIPKKVTSELAFFKNLSPILVQFFKYLGTTNAYPIDTEKVVNTLEEIADEIVERAANPRNWGMAKSMMMGAVEQGLDLSDQQALDQYMYDYNSNLRSSHSFITHPSPQLAQPDPFKHLGRNDKINVQYKDGTTKSGIKFKKVEKDLRAGKCSIVE
ncbi:MAG: hypothetical protein AAF806_07305 [Bacteroidota bacterium]